MKTKILVSAIILASLAFSSCINIIENSVTGDGNVVSETRDVGDFHAIDAAAGLKVFVKFGEMSSELEVVADQNLQEYIVTEVNNGVLKIKTRKNIRRASSRDIFVKAGRIDEIEVSSAADFIGENRLETDDLDIDISSAGEINLDLTANNVYIGVSSSGSAELSGEANKLTANVSSAGDLKAFELVVKEGNIDASSAGSARVHVTENLRANASSAGSIRYEGEPKERNTSSSSAGSVSGR